ncbi:NAD-dependent malic enzyme [Candidatus Falkowbacteria bacterium CG10_big_fil_rev_8_21_14_0_10_39_11]|uniref:NAD-dependent malic enzyme n=1 Tax=Candidatus Falkowbacteria bacterium CG10_big_fil_rev_8_21_14_0_10_39_11 TaxID=1974565 RepID=A0A2H0V4W0_9BACT|nr:MAG: NAD-dependent malic enzyme [Candidatus Falkowbacteria bacterium CG10_big_fil_rev_8_21_14_0_10_39_11]
MDYNKKSLEIHEKHKGKLSVELKVPLKSTEDLSVAYTPGVAEPCREIAKDSENAYKYTIKGNSVAVITDGSSVLGLGNIGGLAGLPVMEGKAALFKEFANIDAYPICLAEQNVQKTIETIKNIAPGFGGINLEDIKAPECFEIEAALQNLGIPVMHDDQHGTAIVVLAALINALKVVSKDKETVRVVVNGAGAAGIAITKLLIKYGFNSGQLIMCDSKGVIFIGREDLVSNKYKQEIASVTNSVKLQGHLSDALKGADIFIGVSVKDAVTQDMVKSMNSDAIIVAMANPDPEILPIDAKAAGATVVATGRSDFPNQVNNVLAFPGLFRGALDSRATSITDDMKLTAAKALAALVLEPNADKILPSPLDKSVVPAIADAVKSVLKS